MRAAILLGSAVVLLGGGVASAARDSSFQVRLSVQSRTAAVGSNWVYSVSAVDARGRPVGGTAVVRVLVRGRVVDTVGWFGFKGSLRRSYRWGPQLAGARAVLQATVITRTGRFVARRVVYVSSRVNIVQGRPRFRATVRAATRNPIADAAWRFTVRAFDRRGRPVGTTAVAKVLGRGRVVDTIGWYSFKGSLSQTYRWSSQQRGFPAVFQVKVIGPGGSRTVGFAIRVR